MNVLRIEPHKAPELISMRNKLEDLQAAVGGYIEALYPFEDTVALVCNEEGKLEGLPLNRALTDDQGHVIDIIAGTFLVVGLTEDNFGSLTSKQADTYTKRFLVPETHAFLNGHLVVIPEN